MASLNLCQFIGNVGRDPESRFMPNGDPVVSFSIGCNWKSKTDEGVEWVRCTAFGKLAEIIQQYVVKGTPIYVSGRMRTRKYEKDGVDTYATEIIVDQMQLLGKKGDADQERETPRASKSTGGGVADLDEDIPF